MIPEREELSAALIKIAQKVSELSTDTLMDPAQFGILAEHADDNALFEELCFQTFKSGFSRQVVVDKWPHFRNLLQRFDVAAVAGLDDQALETLSQDRRIIRNRKKIAAMRDNAQTICAIQSDKGSFGAWLDGFGIQRHQHLQNALVEQFSAVGPVTAYWFMVACDYPMYFCSDASKRLLTRLGWLSSTKAKAEEISEVMLDCLAASDESFWVLCHDLHRFASGYKLNTAICKEGTPNCAKCPLWDECAQFNA